MVPAAFSCSGILRKNQNIWGVSCGSSSHFPMVGFYVVVASSAASFPDRLMFNTFISQEYHLNSFNLMQVSWLVLGNVDVLCS